MKHTVKQAVVSAVYVVCIFTLAIIGLLLVLDLVLLPILLEMLRNPNMQDWCGTLSRCASGARQSFIEHVWSGAPWRQLDIIAIKERAKLAGAVGAFMGVGFVGFSLFSRRR